MDEIGNNKNKKNIRDINSSYILNNIFSFLSGKQILNLIIYNKQIQNFFSLILKIIKK